MTKNYAVKNNETNLNPKKSTIDFILSYSKALKVLKTDEKSFEIFIN